MLYGNPLRPPRGTSCSQHLPPACVWQSLHGEPGHSCGPRGCAGMGYMEGRGVLPPQQGPSGHGPSSAAQALGTACRGCRPDVQGLWVCPASEQKGRNNRMFSFCLSPEGSFSRRYSQSDFNFSSNSSLPSFSFFKDYAESPRRVRKPQSRDSNSKLPKKSMLIPKVIS